MPFDPIIDDQFLYMDRDRRCPHNESEKQIKGFASS